tara:strand:+ start:254 stop:448 length:195 start_codon:yes stop_codon:yes gene_type:complete
MEEQVAPEVVAVVEQKMLITAVLVALVEYMLVVMVLKHRLLTLEQTEVDQVPPTPEAVEVEEAP